MNSCFEKLLNKINKINTEQEHNNIELAKNEFNKRFGCYPILETTFKATYFTTYIDYLEIGINTEDPKNIKIYAMDNDFPFLNDVEDLAKVLYRTRYIRSLKKIEMEKINDN